jgi:WD40 repeat protein
MRARLTIVASLTVTLLATSSPARPAAATDPVLRIEAGSHTAVIWRIATDAKGRWLATASNDKTLRVWDLATGQLIRVLRPPLGDGNEGMLRAVAMSPDGQWIATGGWTSQAGTNESMYIFIFRRTDGALVKPIHDLPNVVLDLAWSPDGRYLAAALGNGQISVYRASDFTLLGSDTDCKNYSAGTDFDRSGRLVTACFDGRIRLYRVGNDGLKLARPPIEAPGGKQPFTVRFSPDGSRIAVGYYDSTRVDVLRADTLALDFSPDTTGADNGNLENVAWSRDDSALFAGGKWSIAGALPSRRWSNGGHGPYNDLPGPTSTIMNLRALPDGGIAFGARDPA